MKQSNGKKSVFEKLQGLRSRIQEKYIMHAQKVPVPTMSRLQQLTDYVINIIETTEENMRNWQPIGVNY